MGVQSRRVKEDAQAARGRERVEGRAVRADVQIRNRKAGVPVWEMWADAHGWKKEAAVLQRETKGLKTSPSFPWQVIGRLAPPLALSIRPFLAAGRGPAPKGRRGKLGMTVPW